MAATPPPTTSHIVRQLDITTPLTPADYDAIEHGEPGEDPLADLSGISGASTLTPEARRLPVGGGDSEVEHMRQEVRRRDLIIESLKRQHAIKVTDLETQIEELRHQKHLAELQLEHEVRRFEGKLAHADERTRKELRELRQKQQRLESQNPLIRERLEEAKGELRDNLVVSESCYLRLKAMPEADLSLQELVQVLVFEREAEQRRDTERLNREVDARGARLADTETELERARSEVSRMKRVHEESTASIRADLALCEERCVRLESEASAARRTAEDLRTKGEMYDDVRRQTDEAEARATTNIVHAQESAGRLERLSAEHGVLTARAAEQDRLVGELTRDRAVAEERVAALTQANDRMRAEITALSDRLAEVTASRESMYQQLISAGEQHRAGFDGRLRDEVARIHQETRQDLERIQADAREVFARENAALREARDAAVAEADRLRARLDDSDARRTEVEREMAQIRASSDARAAEALGQLRIKALECERSKAGREEATAAHKAAAMEADSLRQKAEVLTREYYTLQRDTAARIASLEGAEAVAQARLKQYEALEAELDNALLLTGDVGDGVVSRLGAAVPTSSARRMEQTAKMARRIVELEKEKVGAEQEAAAARDRAETLAAELEEARRLISQTKQPYSYFIETIREKEEEAREARAAAAGLQARVKAAEEDKAALLADLRRMASVRDGLEALRGVVHGIRDKPKARLRASASSARSPARQRGGDVITIRER